MAQKNIVDSRKSTNIIKIDVESTMHTKQASVAKNSQNAKRKA